MLPPNITCKTFPVRGHEALPNRACRRRVPSCEVARELDFRETQGTTARNQNPMQPVKEKFHQEDKVMAGTRVNLVPGLCTKGVSLCSPVVGAQV